MTDADAAQEWLDSWAAGAGERARAAAELAGRVSALTGEAESPDGRIRVTVGSSGQVERLELDDHPELARRILQVMRQAQTSLSGAVAAAVRDTVGTDSETGRAVAGSFAERFPSAPGPEPRP